jgi:hypothetical protein
MNTTRTSLHIGINSYSAAIGQLRYCADDATKLKNILDAHREGFHSTSSILLVDHPTAKFDNATPTRANIIALVKDVCENAKKQDTLLIQFSGHGTLGHDNRLYLLPSDTVHNAVMETSISWQWIIDQVEASTASKKIIILDACHSGAGRDVQGTARMSARLVNEVEATGRGFVCISSCSGGELAYERSELGHGIFTHYLTVGITGAADPLRRGVVEIDSLFKFTYERTVLEAKQIGVTQRPFIITKADTPLDTFVLTALPLDRAISRVLVFSEDPIIGNLLYASISQNEDVRDAKWRNDIDLEIKNAKERFDYTAVYIDVRENWQKMREFIVLVRQRYPVVPFVLVGTRDSFLASLVMEERQRFQYYFFFDLSLPIALVSNAVAETLAQIQWDISKRYGEKIEY